MTGFPGVRFGGKMDTHVKLATCTIFSRRVRARRRAPPPSAPPPLAPERARDALAAVGERAARFPHSSLPALLPPRGAPLPASGSPAAAMSAPSRRGIAAVHTANASSYRSAAYAADARIKGSSLILLLRENDDAEGTR